jgi:hypothetical protein
MQESNARVFATGYVVARTDIITRFKAWIEELQSEMVTDLAQAQMQHVAAHVDRDATLLANTPLPARSALGTLGPRPPRSGSDQDKVLTSVHQNPGMKSIDFVHFLSGHVHERTVRTSLHRLKTRGLIAKHGDGWYTIEELKRVEGQTEATV